MIGRSAGTRRLIELVDDPTGLSKNADLILVLDDGRRQGIGA